MNQVRIIDNAGHPRLNKGFTYNREVTGGGDWRFTSLGGKHSVLIDPSEYRVRFEVVSALTHAPKVGFPPFHTEPHVRIGERIAADLWRDEYTGYSGAPDECAELADQAARAFLKRWKDGFFRGEVEA